VNIPIIYEDDWLLVLDKPPGLLTIPTPRNEQRTLTSILNDDAREKGLSYRLHPCHRLDRDTSGLIIYAKGKSVQEKMMRLFRERGLQKKYIAFVRGAPASLQGRLTSPIEGKSAVTAYRVLERRKDFSVVEVSPVTGRTNQIRIHFKRIGNPVLGDTKFAFRRDFSVKAKRLCLHARHLEFIHPITGKSVSVDSPLAGDMENFLDQHLTKKDEDIR
jgi:23S rRNA pseudouridine1911/1915/1917 synthase